MFAETNFDSVLQARQTDVVLHFITVAPRESYCGAFSLSIGSFCLYAITGSRIPKSRIYTSIVTKCNGGDTRQYLKCCKPWGGYCIESLECHKIERI